MEVTELIMRKFRYLILIILFGLFNNKVISQNSIYDENFVLELASGKEIKLNKFKNKKLLIVNVASRCGFTRQYKELQKLQNNYGDKLNILAVPCNQFGFQEPGSDEEIIKFCKENYDVSFPVTKKSKVVGKNKHEVYAWLTSKRLNGISESTVKWNFQKYLIDENGVLINYFNSNVSPTSNKILKYL